MSEINDVSILEERRRYGVFITRIAWTVEILACITGFLIALNFSGVFKTSFTSDSGIIAITFGIVAIIELTKIPLVTAVYFSLILRMRIVFSIILFLVCLGTFETLMQGFELSQKGRTAEIDNIFQDINTLNEEMKSINIKLGQDQIEQELISSEDQSKRNEINTKYDLKLDIIKSNRNTEINSLEDDLETKRDEKKYILGSNDPSGQINIIQQQIESLDDDIRAQTDCVKRENNEIAKLRSGLGTLINQNEIKAAEKRRSGCERDKKIYVNDKKSLNSKLQQLGSQTAQGQQSQIKVIDKEIEEIELKIKNSRFDFKSQIDKNEKNRNSDLSNLDSKTQEQTISQEEVSENRSELVKRKKEITGSLSEYESSFEKKAYDNQMYRFAKRLFFKEKYVDVTQGMVSFVFFIWFGAIALVVSLVGPGLAYAGLSLRDRRVREEDINIYKKPKRLTNMLRITLIALRKRWSSPKIKKVYQIKEVEVIKEVPVEIIKEKVIEKRVVQKIPVKETKVKYMPIYVDKPPDEKE